MKEDFKWTDELVKEYYKVNSKYTMEEFKQSKQPKKEALFVTFDNVPIYEGDEYWVVFGDYKKDKYIAKEGYSVYSINGRELFSTKEAAEEYIRLNKKTLSITDIIDEIRRQCDGSYSNDPQDWDLPRKASEIINPLIELAKQKIQNNHE